MKSLDLLEHCENPTGSAVEMDSRQSTRTVMLRVLEIVLWPIQILGPMIEKGRINHINSMQPFSSNWTVYSRLESLCLRTTYRGKQTVAHCEGTEFESEYEKTTVGRLVLLRARRVAVPLFRPG